jgi:hypothetical protein
MTQPSGADLRHEQDDLDPRVVEHVEAIRDRFGLRGLRGAADLIAEEIRIAEAAMKELPHD